MKSLLLSALLAGVTLSLLPPSARAAEGVTVRGGGDEVGLQFSDALLSAVQMIEKNYPDLAAAIRPYDLAAFAPTAKIFIVDEPLLVDTPTGKQESVAVNEPSSESIWVNRARWKNTRNVMFRMGIALHEYLSLKGAENTGSYPISSAFLAKMRLRNDPEIFRSGEDASVALYKSIRLSCEDYLKYKDIRTGEIKENRSFALVAVANWTLSGETYGLQFVLGAENKGGLGKMLFGQTISRVIFKDDQGFATVTNGRGVSRQQNGSILESNRKNDEAYQTMDVNGRSESYAWEHGRRGKLTGVTTTSILPDGSLRQESKHLDTPRIVIYDTLLATNTCTATPLATENWIAVANDPEISLDLEKLNARATLVLEAERRLRACTGNCKAEEAELSRLKKDFKDNFAEVYDRRKKKLRGKFVAAPDARDQARDAKILMAEKPVRAQPKPRPRPRPAAAAGAGPIAQEDTFIYPNGRNGTPVLRFKGQSLRLSPAELGANRAIEEYKRKNGLE